MQGNETASQYLEILIQVRLIVHEWIKALGLEMRIKVVSAFLQAPTLFHFWQRHSLKREAKFPGVFILVVLVNASPVFGKEVGLIDVAQTASRLRDHVMHLTETIGERSILFPENLMRAREYILKFYRDANMSAEMQSYDCFGLEVANVIARIEFSESPSRHYIVGAHYDSVEGTVGADDNASAVAVQLETARQLKMLQGTAKLDLAVTLVSFALEEPPIFMTPQMGSRIYAADAKRRGEKIDGMICLEMVGYTCHKPGCQDYPFPLMFMNYPKEGNFIGVVGNFGSRPLTRALVQAFNKNVDLPVVHLTVPFNGWLVPAVRLSDHASFWDYGYNAVMITDSAFYRNPHYHTQSDTVDKLDFPFMAQLVRSMIIFFASLSH